MDRMAIRNLLKSPKIQKAILTPMLYPKKTFDVFCEVLEAAQKWHQDKNKCGVLTRAVQKLNRLK